MLIKATKSGKVRCPVCDKLQHPLHDDEKDVMVLECCNKVWSLFAKDVIEAKAKPKTEVDDKAELLRRLYYGKKEKEEPRNADRCG